MSQRPLRVVQWATGNVGTRSLREIIRHPDLELAGLVVYTEAKNGVDAGTLCGEGPTRVLATTNHAEAMAVDADCALYMPQVADVDEVISMLASGTNVVTVCLDFQAEGRLLTVEQRRRLEEACVRGNTSVYATGSSPGFITDALPLALLSMQRQVDLIEIEEFANLSQRDSTHMLFEQMGFGKPLGPVSAERAGHLGRVMAPALELLAEAAGQPVEEWSMRGEVAAVRNTMIVAAGELHGGTVGGQRTIVSGSAAGHEIVRFTANWYCSTDLDPAWDLLPTGWRVKVRGDAAMDVTIEFPVALEDLGDYTPALTANRPVNAVPFVCAAKPGLLTIHDLPPVTPAAYARTTS